MTPIISSLALPFIVAVLLSIWNLQIQCFRLFGGSLDSIGYLLAAKVWLKIHLNFTGLSSYSSSEMPSLRFSFVAFWIIHAWLCFLQALYNFFGIWCVLCCYLCCRGMCHWNSCLLLSAMYNCTLICSGRSGNSHDFFVLFFSHERLSIIHSLRGFYT